MDLIVILGATASGKTGVAATLAHKLKTEIISADSRQVYRGMDIGTGKDYDDYIVDNQPVPYHLIDIVDPGYKYSVFEYQKDFLKAYTCIREKGKIPVLCGGTGMYIEAVLNGYNLVAVPPDHHRRAELELIPMDKLAELLGSLTSLHNITDLTHRKRLIRAIEIAEFKKKNKIDEEDFPKADPLIFGIRFDRETRRQRITERLKQRLESGMTEEVRELLQSVNPEDLEYYGLEYKFITWYCTGQITYEEMFSRLNTAIHQFAKRQMTWFRKMERDGHRIQWIDGALCMEDKIRIIGEVINQRAY